MQQFPRGSPKAASSPQDIITRSGSNWQGKEGGGRREEEGREEEEGGVGEGEEGGEERGGEKKKTEHIRHSSLIQIESKSQTENQLSSGLRM